MSFISFLCLTNAYLICAVFEFTAELTNNINKTRQVKIFTSLVSWPGLQQELSKHFNVYLTALHAQYRFSTDKGSLPCDLTSNDHLLTMLKLLKPLILPPRLANGNRSNRQMKPMTVQIFNQGDDPQMALKTDGKASRLVIHKLVIH